MSGATRGRTQRRRDKTKASPWDAVFPTDHQLPLASSLAGRATLVQASPKMQARCFTWWLSKGPAGKVAFLTRKEIYSSIGVCRKTKCFRGILEPTLTFIESELSHPSLGDKPHIKCSPSVVTDTCCSYFPVSLLCSLLCPQVLTRFLAHSRCSITISAMKEGGSPRAKLFWAPSPFKAPHNCLPTWRGPRPRRPKARIRFDWQTHSHFGLRWTLPTLWP